MYRGILAIAGFVVLIGLTAPAAYADSTIKTIKDRGFIKCGVTDRVPGFSAHGTDGVWTGFYIDYCRAAAVAVLGDADAIEVDSYWLDALEGGDIDVLHAGSTWTFSRDTHRPIDFPIIYFYDGQGFIAHAKLGARTLTEALAVDNAKVCAIDETSTAYANLQEFMRLKKTNWDVIPVRTMDGMWRAFFGGRCDMAIHDRSALSAVHAGRLDDSDDYVVFPEVISKEPLAPAVRDDDVQWRNFIAWLTYVTIAAEELGISSKNVDEIKATSKSANVLRLLGTEPGMGKGFSLSDDWAYNVIKTIGNYGEIFDRNLGKDTNLNMARGLNDLWSNGGLLMAPPLR